MFTKVFIIIVLLQSTTSAFNPSALNPSINRRNMLNIITKSPAIIPFIPVKKTLAQQSVENKPLTPEEMEEYNKLLKEAKRIQNIIDFNINASKKLLLQDGENGLEKYIRENNIQK